VYTSNPLRPTSRLLTAALVLGLCQVAWAQSSHFGLGRTPTADEGSAFRSVVGRDGKELPPGRGSAKEGAQVYAAKCAVCHGANGEGQAGPFLIGPKPSPADPQSMAGMDHQHLGLAGGLIWWAPFATVYWDFINRAMPLDTQASLTPDEVYSVTAFLLFKNKIIRADEVLDEHSLPKVKMPNRDGYHEPK
jgi:cytochrome c